MAASNCRGSTLKGHVLQGYPPEIVGSGFECDGGKLRLPRKDLDAHINGTANTHLSAKVAKHAKEIKTLKAANVTLTKTCEMLKRRVEILEKTVHALATELVHQNISGGLSMDQKFVSRANVERENSTKERAESLAPSRGASSSVLPSTSLLNRSVCSDTGKGQEDDDDYEYIDCRSMTLVVDHDNKRGSHYIKMMPRNLLRRLRMLSPTHLVMKNFTKHKADCDSWFSPPFFTHNHGYKMYLRVTANGQGSGKGTHITLGVYLINGEYDDQLEWPFRGDIIIQLLDQKGSENHFTRTIFQATGDREKQNTEQNYETDIINAWTIDQFKSLDELYSKYLCDDSLKFCVHVDLNPSSVGLATDV